MTLTDYACTHPQILLNFQNIYEILSSIHFMSILDWALPQIVDTSPSRRLRSSFWIRFGMIETQDTPPAMAGDKAWNE
jgi:hypothetical protein